jgi:hypothetical protein
MGILAALATLVALVAFLLATFSAPEGRVKWVPLGLLALTLALIFGGVLPHSLA